MSDRMKQFSETLIGSSEDNIDQERRHLIKVTGTALAASMVMPLSLATELTVPYLDKVEEFSRSIRGKVIPKGLPNYEPWRRSMVWNYRTFDRHPDIIVQADSDEDVIATVNFARKNKLKIKSRGGGHSWSGCYLRDSGILLDLSRLQSVDIDAANQTVTIGAGVLGRALNERLAEHGLVFPTAHCGMVPLSGFMMGGGLGVNFSGWGGMSTFSILAMDVVTPDGHLRHVNASENPELFWAARGGGPGLFFSVLRFKLKCYPLPTYIRTDTYILPYDELVPTVAMMDEMGPIIGNNTEMLTVVMPNPLNPDAANPIPGKGFDLVTVLGISAFVNTKEEASRKLDPIRNHPQMNKAVFKQLDRHSTMEHLYQDNEGPFPQRRARADNIFTDRVVDATKVLSAHMLKAPTAGNSPVILYMGDQKMSPKDACYSATGRFYLAAYAQWDDAKDDLANQQWLKNLYDEMLPFASGHYINEYDRETRGAETDRCYRQQDWLRLKKLRAHYDPEGVYHGFLGEID